MSRRDNQVCAQCGQAFARRDARRKAAPDPHEPYITRWTLAPAQCPNCGAFQNRKRLPVSLSEIFLIALPVLVIIAALLGWAPLAAIPVCALLIFIGTTIGNARV